MYPRNTVYTQMVPPHHHHKATDTTTSCMIKMNCKLLIAQLQRNVSYYTHAHYVIIHPVSVNYCTHIYTLYSVDPSTLAYRSSLHHSFCFRTRMRATSAACHLYFSLHPHTCKELGRNLVDQIQRANEEITTRI